MGDSAGQQSSAKCGRKNERYTFHLGQDQQDGTSDGQPAEISMLSSFFSGAFMPIAASAATTSTMQITKP
jgi:hypothetical protein